jgi:signal transduction histidine kinase
MRSIRLSLVVYFLGLVGVALGVASLLVYGIAQRTLRDKEEAAGKLIDARYEERRREAEKRLNNRLFNHAKALAGRVRPRPRWDRFHHNGQPHFTLYGRLGLLTGYVGPHSHTIAPWLVWWIQSYQYRPEGGRFRGRPVMLPIQTQLWHHDLIELRLGQDVALPPEDDLPRISALIETNHWGRALQVGDKLHLPSEADFAPNERLTWDIADYRLPDGVPVRKVRFRSRISLQDWPERPPGPGGGGPRSFRPTFTPPPPAIIIQCAADTRELDAALEGVRRQRDEERRQLRADTTAALHYQRNWLLVITGLTFAATILGCVGLVWLGLVPLRRLSDAVSKVSPRNFTLALGDKPLPAELHPIADRLSETLELLRRAFAREKQATADISHELRTPLAALMTNIELALRKQRPPEQYREMLQECRSSAQQMNQIIERLLTLARLDAGVDRLRPQPVDVAELAEQCATVVRPLAEARGLRLSVRNEFARPDAPSGPAPRLTTDPDKLREVLNNLLHNAIQYNRPDGKIDLVVARHDGRVQLEVRDTGIGIAAESRELIFERFYRADPSRTSDGMNAGLGLAIVKEYVELMGGQIRVESAPGQGSTFRVELPVQAPASAA